MQNTSTKKAPVDMTLRLWSDTIPLGRFADVLGYKIDHLYFKGEPMAPDGVFAGRPATRHFASLGNAKGDDVSDIAYWLKKTIAAVASDNELSNLLRSGQIEALFWIALFGREPVPAPVLDASLVNAVADLGGRIFLENYTDIGPECPTKIWLPATPKPLPDTAALSSL